jgi:hypothetical protein
VSGRGAPGTGLARVAAAPPHRAMPGWPLGRHPLAKSEGQGDAGRLQTWTQQDAALGRTDEDDASGHQASSRVTTWRCTSRSK